MELNDIVSDFQIEFVRNLKTLADVYELHLFLDIIKNDLSGLLVADKLAHEQILDIVYRVHQVIIVGIKDDVLDDDYLHFKLAFFRILNTTIVDMEYQECYEQCYNITKFKNYIRDII